MIGRRKGPSTQDILQSKQKEDLQKKLKQRQMVMRQVRTNTCSAETISKVAEMDPKLQGQVLQQLRAKKVGGGGVTQPTTTTTTTAADKPPPTATATPPPKKKRTTATTAAARRKKKSVPKKTAVSGEQPAATEVSQSTEETDKTIANAKSKILLAAVEAQMESILSSSSVPPELKEMSQKGFGILKTMLTNNPEVATKINQQILQWSSLGSLPNEDSIRRFVQELADIHKKSIGQSKPYRFDHDCANESAPNNTTITGTATSSPAPSSVTQSPSTGHVNQT